MWQLSITFSLTTLLNWILRKPTTFHFSAVSKTFFPQIPDFDQNADKTGALLVHYLFLFLLSMMMCYISCWVQRKSNNHPSNPSTALCTHPPDEMYFYFYKDYLITQHSQHWNYVIICYEPADPGAKTNIMKTAIIIGLRTELTWPFQHILINKNYFLLCSKNAWSALCTF